MGFVFAQIRVVWLLYVVVTLWMAYGLFVGVRGSRVTWRQAGCIAYGWAGLEPTPDGFERLSRWLIYVSDALAVLNVVLVVYMWQRHEPIIPFAVPAAFASFVLTLVAWFVGRMAISNSWL